MRTFYDAVTPSNIPVDAAGVCGYVDGRYAWKPSDWARFPHAVKVRIAVFPATNDGHVLDVERGDATPEQAPGWVVMRRKAGVDPSVYCSLFAWGIVRAAFTAAKVAEPHYWIAAYPGNGPNLYDGAVAHQYANPGPVDISVVADYWPGVDQSPIVTPTSQPTSHPAPPTPTPTPTPTPIGGLTVNIIDLSHADNSHLVRGPGVAPLQRLLQVTADGLGGAGTRAALYAYQQRKGLKPDAVFGPATASSLLAG